MAICAGVGFATLTLGIDRMRVRASVSRRLAPVAIVATLVALVIGGGGLLGDVWDEFRNETPRFGSTTPPHA